MRQRIDGVTLGYDLSGGDAGPAILFLHAFPLTRRMWSGQVEAMRGHARSLAVDFRGFGDSDVPSGPYRLEAFADETVALAQALGVQRAVVVGLSMGGYVAFRLLDRAPGFVRGLVLADTRAEADSPEARSRRYALAERVEREGLDAMADFLNGLVGPTSKSRRAEVVERVQALIGRPESRALAETLRALGERPDSRPLLSRIEVPTLILVGAEDTLTPPDSSRAMAEAIRGSRLTVIPECGHLSNLEAADAFNGEVTSFLTSLPPEPVG